MRVFLQLDDINSFNCFVIFFLFNFLLWLLPQTRNYVTWYNVYDGISMNPIGYVLS